MKCKDVSHCFNTELGPRFDMGNWFTSDASPVVIEESKTSNRNDLFEVDLRFIRHVQCDTHQ